MLKCERCAFSKGKGGRLSKHSIRNHQMRTAVPPPRYPPNKIVDSGLDETSCFFADDDGEEIAHGHYFEELSASYITYTTEGYSDFYRFKVFDGGNFPYDLSKRKVGLPRERRLSFELGPVIHCLRPGGFGLSRKPR